MENSQDNITFKSNFKFSEIRCKCGCGEDNISMPLMQRVQIIRWLVNEPLTVNSGVRCAEYNQKIGGVPDSEHVPTVNRPGEGIDLKVTDSVLRRKIVFLATILGLRIGDGPGFIHLGIRSTKPKKVLWNYY